MRQLVAVVVVVALIGGVASARADELYDAAKKGDEQAVAALIAAKAVVDEPNGQGWTPLIIASYSGHLGVVRKLLDAGADPNYSDGSGFTALVQGARFGHLEIVKLLVARKAKLDVRLTGGAYAGKSLLLIVLEDKQDAVARWLIEQKVDVNAAGGSGTTPLMIAVGRGSTEIVKLLMAAKADVKLVDAQGNDALVVAAMRGNVELATQLIGAGAAVDGKNNNGATPLFHAAHAGKYDFVKLLLDRGAAARVREQKFGDTALFRAAQAGAAGVVKLLLDKGAPPDEANNAGETPLMAAAANGHTGVVEALLDKNAAIDVRDKQQRTATMRAQKSGHARVAELLEARGAKVSPAERQEADADARARWFVDAKLERCAMLDVKDVGLERCTRSLPTPKPGVRKFEVTVRDMSRLEKGNPLKADHVLVGAVTLKPTAAEYVHLEASSHYALGDRIHLVAVPVVTGTPNAYTDGRVLLFLYDEARRKFTSTSPVWTSGACGAGCTAQSTGLITKKGKIDVELSQTAQAGERRTVLAWDAKKRKLAPRKP